MLKAILILPFNVLITIPVIILYFCDFKLVGTQQIILLMVAIFLFVLGFILMSWTIFLLFYIGKGSLAPWNPTQKLVTSGPYAYVRNPMLTGVFFCFIRGSCVISKYGVILVFINFCRHQHALFSIF